MAINFASQVSLTISNVLVLSSNSSGVVTTPLQPSFCAPSGTATTVGSIVIPSTTTFNVGNCYNTANGRFTAPIAGIYHFRWHQLGPNAGSGRHDAGFYKNGALYNGTRFILNRETASTFESIHIESHIQLAVNDYVQVVYLTGPGALWADNGYGTFNGYLIG
jgi:hypothetical protein